MISDEEIHLLYGENAAISRKGPFVLVHLDRPSRELIHHRTEHFDPDAYFERNCSICALQREAGLIVFDEGRYDDEEEILLE